ncbi:hypothetical protein L6261_02770 [Candidatus Parcubacteria bacterium]|nr:hypothetical protein [Candidatus Parcubacteria bacterium]
MNLTETVNFEKIRKIILGILKGETSTSNEERAALFEILRFFCDHSKVVIHSLSDVDCSSPYFYCLQCGLRGCFTGDRNKEGIYFVSREFWDDQISHLARSNSTKLLSSKEMEKLVAQLKRKEKNSFKFKKLGREARMIMHREQGGRLF